MESREQEAKQLTYLQCCPNQTIQVSPRNNSKKSEISGEVLFLSINNALTVDTILKTKVVSEVNT